MNPSDERTKTLAPSQTGPFGRNRVLAFSLAVSMILHVDAVLFLDAILGALPSGVTDAPPSVMATLRTHIARAPDPPAAWVTGAHQRIPPQPAHSETAPPEPARRIAPEPPPTQPPLAAAFEEPVAATATEPFYFTPGELSRRPQLLSFVEINADADPAPSLPARARFRILINEHGEVDQVVSDDSDLPPRFEEATRDAFLSAKYAPGEIDGVAVRSQIRIEVTYDGPAVLQTPLK